MKRLLKNFFKKATILIFRLKGKVSLKVGKNTMLYRCDLSNPYGCLNSIEIGNNSSLKNCKFKLFGGGNKIIIGDNVLLKGMTFWIEDSNNIIKIGDRTTSENHVQVAACEGKKIEIGADCMLSHDIYFRTTDSHSIVDNKGKRVNPADNIKIGNHVWIGMQCLIFKGVEIPDDCIIGARSVVTKHKFDKNSLILGINAKVIKQDINWIRKRI